MTLKAFEDANHDGNSAKYHTGKPCVEKGCKHSAGTWWSPLWCFEHNVARIRRISASLDDIVLSNRLREMVDAETTSLRKMLEFYQRQADKAALINWKPLDDLQIKDRDVLLSHGMAYVSHVGRWRDAHPQRDQPARNYHKGWWSSDGRNLGEKFEWYAEIPPAPFSASSSLIEPSERAEG
jgi:hypothetical protein